MKPYLRLHGADTTWHRGLDDEEMELPLENDENFFLALFFVLLIIFCLIFMLRNPTQFCRRFCCREVETREERERRFRNSLRPPTAQGHYGNNQDRLDFISNVLVTKHVILAGGSKHDTAVHKFHDIVIPRLNSSLHTAVDDGETLDPCSICLNEYKEGDEICWSHNKHCNHVFHSSCITIWLFRHDECPICRQDFLSLEYLDDDEEVQETTEHGVTSQHSTEHPASDRGHAAMAASEAAPVEAHPFSMVAMFQRSRLVRPSPRTVQPTRRDEHLELSQVNDEERVRSRPPTNHAYSSVSDTDDSTTDGLEDVDLESNETEVTDSSVSVSV